MSIRTKIAESASERHACFRLRHRVFIETEGKFPSQPANCHVDRYDAYGTSLLFLAYEKDKAVGTLRLSMDDADMGMPADDYFDFRRHLSRSENIKLANTNQLCVDPDHRGQLRIMNSLIMLAYYWGYRNDVSHVVAPFNPRLTRTMERIGFKRIGEVVKSHHFGLDIQPMVLEMNQIRDSFIAFINKQEVVHLMEPYFREYYDEGEVVIQEGDEGELAYFVVDGTASIQGLNRGKQETIAEIGPGELFGEIALMVNIRRTATVIAKTPLEVMVLSRTQFMESIKNNPAEVSFMLKTLGVHLSQLLSRL